MRENGNENVCVRACVYVCACVRARTCMRARAEKEREREGGREGRTCYSIFYYCLVIYNLYIIN